jgi:hypothetical protein
MRWVQILLTDPMKVTEQAIGVEYRVSGVGVKALFSLMSASLIEPMQPLWRPIFENHSDEWSMIAHSLSMEKNPSYPNGN